MRKSISILFLLIGIIYSYGQVVVYTDCNYSGNAQSLQAKSYVNASQIGLPDNSISSIKIPEGYQAIIYTESNMKGREVTLTSNQQCLPAVLKKQISSIVISKTSTIIGNGGKILIYRYCRYNGTVKHFEPGNYGDLRAELGNTLPQSFQIPKGLKVELYSQRNFKGRRVGTLSSNQICVSKTMQQQSRSMKIVKINTSVTPQPR